MNTEVIENSLDVLHDFLGYLDHYFGLDEHESLRYKIERKRPQYSSDCIIAIMIAANRLSKHHFFQDFMASYERNLKNGNQEFGEMGNSNRAMVLTKKEFAKKLEKLSQYAIAMDDSGSDCFIDSDDEYEQWVDRSMRR